MKGNAYFRATKTIPPTTEYEGQFGDDPGHLDEG